MAVRIGSAGGGSSKKKKDSRFKGVNIVSNQKKRKKRTKTEIQKEELAKEQNKRKKEAAKKESSNEAATNVRVVERVISSILQAADQNKSLEILYKDTTGKRSRRTVDPYSFKMTDKGLKLMAFCNKRKDLRSFYLKRITEAIVLGITYTPTHEVTIKKDWESVRSSRHKL